MQRMLLGSKFVCENKHRAPQNLKNFVGDTSEVQATTNLPAGIYAEENPFPATTNFLISAKSSKVKIQKNCDFFEFLNFKNETSFLYTKCYLGLCTELFITVVNMLSSSFKSSSCGKDCSDTL